MSRPAGVTASAVVEFIGSAIMLFVGAVMMFAMAAPREATPAPVAAIGVAMGIVCIGLAALGVWTGVALLKVKPWARISTLVFAGVMAAFSLMLMVGMLLIPAPPGPDPKATAMFEAMRPMIAAVYVVPFAIGVWWLVYFNRAATKAVFAAPYEPGAPPARPLSISIIAWLSVVSGPVVLSMALMGMPAFLGGVVMTGGTAQFAYTAIGVLSLYLGWSVLKLKEAGRKGMIVWYSLTMLHSVYVSLVPDVRARMRELQQSMPFAAPPTTAFDSMPFTIASMMFGVAMGAIAIYFLVKERSRFT